ncbi:MAG: biotin/lipoyl-binding protein [Chloroflexi bacterium]|nr:biotin/lipoyl-binding protein [Chloroflexota bacterium]
MKYQATIDNRVWTVELVESDGEIRVTVDDLPLAVDWVEIGRGRYSLLLDNRSYELIVSAAGPVYLVATHGRVFEVAVADERELALARMAAPAKHEGGETAIAAPMPGLVRAVNVAPGSAVQAGETLVVLEAMKMENDLKAPRDGVVKDVRVAPGAKVDQRQVLVTLA